MKSKLKYIFVLVLCLVLAISPKVNAAYTFFEGPSTNVPWVFVWSNGYRRGPTVTSIFKLRGDAGDVRDTFCIQSIIHTDYSVNKGGFSYETHFRFSSGAFPCFRPVRL